MKALGVQLDRMNAEHLAGRKGMDFQVAYFAARENLRELGELIGRDVGGD